MIKKMQQPAAVSIRLQAVAVERSGECLSRRRVFSASDAGEACGILNSYKKFSLGRGCCRCAVLQYNKQEA
jgi:hypothetical protein